MFSLVTPLQPNSNGYNKTVFKVELTTLCLSLAVIHLLPSKQLVVKVNDIQPVAADVY